MYVGKLEQLLTLLLWGAMLSNRYNIYIHDKITALDVPSLPAVAKQNMILEFKKQEPLQEFFDF
ncbi:hypothetical protein BN000_02816 [Neobacillus massiliamazoniensis]|uniref:Uncharacterized protein n=1 Tax=Neobacillus massiliamazoniensis TaxID=1499688 RepID=A0A0U1NXX9_9BACI|nr:hypothetical protein BN000_02816 [Neobacillus massiliamazoniensis]